MSFGWFSLLNRVFERSKLGIFYIDIKCTNPTGETGHLYIASDASEATDVYIKVFNENKKE